MEYGRVFFWKVKGLRLGFEEVPKKRFAEPFGLEEHALVHLKNFLIW